MAKRLVNKDGQEVRIVMPPVADGRVMVQHVDGGLVEVIDVRELRTQE